jgi:hypothetical protein
MPATGRRCADLTGHLCRGYETAQAGASISYAVIGIFAPNSLHHELTVEIEHGSLSDQRR